MDFYTNQETNGKTEVPDGMLTSKAHGEMRTLADLEKAVDGFTDLDAATKRIMKSSIRSIGRASLAGDGLGNGAPNILPRRLVDLRTVPCDPAWLNPRLFKVGWKALGYKTAKSFYTQVSTGRRVMRRVGTLDDDLPELPREPGGWHELIDRANRRRDLAGVGLGGFAKWSLHRRGIGPTGASGAMLVEYEAYVRHHTLQDDIPGHIRVVARAWRFARELIGANSGGPLVLPERQERYALPLEAYPASFQDEVVRHLGWLAGTTRRGPFRGDGPPKIQRDRSIYNRRRCILEASAGLVHSGTPIEQVTGLASLVRLDAFEALTTWHWERPIAAAVARGDYSSVDVVPKSVGVTANLGVIATALLSIARHYVKIPTEELRVLAEMARDVKPPKRGHISEKNRARVRQFDAPKTEYDLLSLFSQMLAKARDPKGKLHRRRRAVLMRNAVAIEFLLHTPLRIKNLCSLQPGKHLRTDGGRSGHFSHLVIDGAEMKNGITYETEVSPDVAKALSIYLTEFRPHLAPGGSKYLFPGEHGVGHITEYSLATGMKQLIRTEVGAQWHPHLMRHLAARSTLKDDPGAIEDVRQLLGDKGLEVVMAHYTSEEPIAAARRHHARIARMRKGSAQTTKPPPRRDPPGGLVAGRRGKR